MILIFGGTTEGRIAVDVCELAGKPFYYSTKSDMQDVEMKNGIRLVGAMTADDIVSFCKEKKIKCIIDAAHPFAENIHLAVMKSCLPVIRIQRRHIKRIDGVHYCKDFQEATKALEKENISLLLALTGVNTISKLKGYWTNHNTIFRILNRQESREIAMKNGLPEENLIYYDNSLQIPSKENEMQLMKSVGCDAIITKDSGSSGGFEEKINAAIELGLKVFVVEPPQFESLAGCSETEKNNGECKDHDKTTQPNIIFVEGKHGLRRAIEHLSPDFFPLKTGFTTGACATAAVKAALLSLLNSDCPEEIAFMLPDGETMYIPVEVEAEGKASVVKDFSDDPDVTRGCKITAAVRLNDTGEIRFLQGEGVGKVTMPGLGIPVGGPAINSTPREMMTNEVRALTDCGCDITITVENGRELARSTFNHKVGVIDGISIIGTSGIVSPLSNEAFVESIGRELDVAKAIGCNCIGLASGKNGETALKAIYPQMRIIHYGNFIGESLKKAQQLQFEEVHIGIMIGKAVKLAEGHLDTHSHKVQMNKDFLKSVAGNESEKIDGITMARELWNIMSPSFFEKIKQLCYNNCRTVFPDGKLQIHLICDEKAF